MCLSVRFNGELTDLNSDLLILSIWLFQLGWDWQNNTCVLMLILLRIHTSIIAWCWYSSSSYHVTVSSSLSPDKDECLDSTHLCSRHSQCFNTSGSYTCQCLEDYSGDGHTCWPRRASQSKTSMYLRYKLSKRTRPIQQPRRPQLWRCLWFWLMTLLWSSYWRTFWVESCWSST